MWPAPRASKLALWSCLAPLNSLVDLVKQGQHITGITRIPLRYEVGKDKTRRGFGGEARLSTKLRRAIALAFDNRGNGEIIGVDQFTVAELLAMGQLGRLFPDEGMVVHCRRERKGETYTLGLRQRMCLFEVLFGLQANGFDGFTSR
jgi:hypothetical protein